MIYKYFLRFTSPVHFGREGIGQEMVEQRLRSDTLWGAVIQKWLLLYEDAPDNLCRNTPFRLSSSFPVIGGMSFFPLPTGALDHLISAAAQMEEPPVALKDLKKIGFIAEPLFHKIVSGAKPDFDDIQSGTVFPEPGLSGCADQKAAKTGSSMMQRPRLEVDRLRGGGIEGNFFYCSDQFFDQDSGLFFLAVFDNPESQSKFDAALRLLGDSGLGADRSVGRGMFSFSVDEHKPPKTKDADSYLLLSLYHPGRDEVKQGILEAPGTAYSLTRRSGHAASHLTTRFRRHDLWVLEEGSILGEKPVGDICTVLEKSNELGIPHNVYRNGQAFYLPINNQCREMRS